LSISPRHLNKEISDHSFVKEATQRASERTQITDQYLILLPKNPPPSRKEPVDPLQIAQACGFETAERIQYFKIQ
jgi:hypothetical protein